LEHNKTSVFNYGTRFINVCIIWEPRW